MSPPNPAHEPVHRYLAALADLDRAIANLLAAQAEVSETLQGFDDLLRALPAAPTPAPATPLSTAALWRPRDPVHFTGLTDLYEVVGRFAFEGDDGSNLAAMQQLVAAIRAEVERQRAALSDLARIPSLAETHATSLGEADDVLSQTRRTELLQRFGPAAAALCEIAQKLSEALRAEKKPHLTDLETAQGHYQNYVARLQGLYEKALPSLREQLAELCRVAGVEVPPSWPDRLPFAPSLSVEFLTAPPDETSALTAARQTLEAIKTREDELTRTLDELGVQLRRCQDELNTLAQREANTIQQAVTALAVLRWATKLDELDAVRQGAAALASEVQAREQARARLRAEQQRITAMMETLQKDASECAQSLTASKHTLATQLQNEPSFFGKGEWRRTLDELQASIDALGAELTRKQQQIQGMQHELVQLRERDQVEQDSLSSLARQREEIEARDEVLMQELATLERELGAARPPRRLTIAQAEESLEATLAAREHVRVCIERMSDELRRIREDTDRTTVQLRRAQSDRERQAELVAVEQRRSDAARGDALRILVSRCQAAFESHTQQVLSQLTDSLSQVGSVFVEPARQVLLMRAVTRSGLPERMRERAVAFAHALAETSRRVEGTLAAELARIEGVERDFLARAPEAFRHLWT